MPRRGRADAVSPGDIAALVRTNRQAGLVQGALRAVGVPAVIGGTESVFGSPNAADWLRLLEALEQPASRPRAVAVALTPFIGMTAADVAGADETTWELLHARLHRWAGILRRRGVATATRAIMASEGLPGRILLEPTGERDLTDLGHIAELLHAEASAGQLGPPALRAWLARRIDEAGAETADAEDRSRRLDSDADAVQVLTIHRAKGLEFPVVYCPYLWDSGPALRKGRPVVYHDAATGNQRTLDVGVTDPDPELPGSLRRRPRRAARRGSPAPLRGAHPGPPPGGGLVGSRLRVSALPARPPADESRPGRQRGRQRDLLTERGRRPSPVWRPWRPGFPARSASSGVARMPPPAGRGPRPTRPTWPWPGSTAASTGRGVAPPTAASSSPTTATTWAASPNCRASPTSPTMLATRSAGPPAPWLGGPCGGR